MALQITLAEACLTVQPGAPRSLTVTYRVADPASPALRATGVETIPIGDALWAQIAALVEDTLRARGVL